MRDSLSGIFPPIPTPFDAAGEVDLRALETNVRRWMTTGLAGILALGSNGEAALLDERESDAIVATGGGCFAQETNRGIVARLGFSLFLDVPYEIVRSRLSGKTDRPLFRSVEQLAQLFAERAAFYRMASASVELSGSESVDEAADRVLLALEERETLSG